MCPGSMAGSPTFLNNSVRHFWVASRLALPTTVLCSPGGKAVGCGNQCAKDPPLTLTSGTKRRSSSNKESVRRFTTYSPTRVLRRGRKHRVATEKAAALRNISFAWRSSRFSRSNALSRSPSSLLIPGPSPASRSARRKKYATRNCESLPVGARICAVRHYTRRTQGPRQHLDPRSCGAPAAAANRKPAKRSPDAPLEGSRREHNEIRLGDLKTGARAIPLSPTARRVLADLPRSNPTTRG